MKRFIFSAIALMVVTTACTESGLIDAPQFYGSRIAFDTYIGKAPITKAESVDLSYLESNASGGARVYAFMCETGNRDLNTIDFSSAYMDGRIKNVAPTTYKADGSIDSYGKWQYEVSKGNAWSVEEVYWPGDVDLAFAAYNLKADDSKYISNRIGLTQFDFTVAQVVSEQVDLLATPLTFVSEDKSGETTVGLRFSHLLSRVGFKILPTNLNDITIYINNVKLCGAFPKSGHVNLASAVSYGSQSGIPQIVPNTSGEYATEYSLFSENESFSIESNDCAGVDENNAPIIKAQPIYNNASVTANTPAATKAALEANRYMMIMPGPAANTILEVSYMLEGETESHIARVPLKKADNSEWSFDAGKAYELVLKIANKSIEFEAEIIEGIWEQSTPDSIN